uniref:UBA domain-containing protein n=1 Tax=Heterorhabditis bacteriophora TaxID=37862 RepID=A0A1I7XNX4_HETBA
MPKKFANENTKVIAARERKAAAKKDEHDKKKKDDEERKRQEILRRKEENRKLVEAEMNSLSGKIIPVITQKVTRATIDQHREAEIKHQIDEQKRKQLEAQKIEMVKVYCGRECVCYTLEELNGITAGDVVDKVLLERECGTLVIMQCTAKMLVYALFRCIEATKYVLTVLARSGSLFPNDVKLSNLDIGENDVLRVVLKEDETRDVKAKFSETALKECYKMFDSLNKEESGYVSSLHLAETGPTQSAPLPVITHDMLRQAMAFAYGGPSTVNVPTPSPSSSRNSELRARYSAELAQLVDFGFTDELTNLSVLETSEGNVEVALELLISMREDI